jgi:hypothetical protein
MSHKQRHKKAEEYSELSTKSLAQFYSAVIRREQPVAASKLDIVQPRWKDSLIKNTASRYQPDPRIAIKRPPTFVGQGYQSYHKSMRSCRHISTRLPRQSGVADLL